MMAIWATADPDAMLRQSACLAALDVQHAIHRFNHLPDMHALSTRIGLHSGYIVLGNIGAMDHFEYRPVGDIVNTASRIEGLNKYLGTCIIVSEEVITHLDDFLLRYLGQFLLSGKKRPVAAYELIDRKEMTTEHQRELCKTFERGIKAFSQHAWVEAMEYFEKCLKIELQDGPSTFYLNWYMRYHKDPSQAMINGIIRLENK
jgi:adenylate cyclase